MLPVSPTKKKVDSIAKMFDPRVRVFIIYRSDVLNSNAKISIFTRESDNRGSTPSFDGA